MYNKISILGCGWLGLPLGAHLAGKGFVVKGSTTTSEKLPLLKKKNIDPYFLILNPSIRCRNIQEFLESEVIIINIPPPRKRPDLINFHLAQLNAILPELKKSHIKKGIFISSTSVYGDENKILTESDPLHPSKKSGEALVKAEQLLMNLQEVEFTVLRFGGLIGDDRNPVKYMAGRHIANGKAPVNLIHQQDCIHIIEKIIEKDVWDEVFNAVADEHPTKAEFYTAAAKAKSLPLPQFDIEKGDWKIIGNEKIKKALDYEFTYSTPMQMIL